MEGYTMSADIAYTDFGVTELKHIENGDHFLWGGNLYQKVEPHWSSTKTFDRCNNEQEPEYHSRNAIQTQDGKTFYFYDEESVVPVSVKIEVSREEPTRSITSAAAEEIF
jgi:hypothetical protein